MTTDHHTAWIDGTTVFEDSVMNAPLSALDATFGGSFSGKKGRIARINDAESALEYFNSAYDVGGAYNGSPTSSLVLMRLPMVRTIVFPSGMADSKMIAGTAATAQTVFSIKIDGVEFATATFAISGTVATFACASDQEFIAGEVLTIVAPASPDVTLADLGWLLAATRNDYA
jgi:hypothetical protein